MKKFCIIIFTTISLFGAGCGSDTWIGFYYPDATDLTVNTQSGTFKTKEECVDWVDGERMRLNPDRTRRDDYECGKNCKEKMGINVCEVTER